MSPSFHRAVVLYQQSRFDLATTELRRHLADDPGDARCHALLGVCLGHQEEFAAAEAEIGEAIALAPDEPYPHYCRSLVFAMRSRFDDAEEAARTAVELDPTSATYHGQLARALFGQRKWRAALDAALAGLQHDPDDTGCGNLRTMALSKLGNQDAAIAAVDELLARDPDDALSHANKGWALVHQGKSKQALEHFREALRLDPTLDYARSGMVEALKAQNPLYRWILGYFLWMSRLDRRVQWGIIIGGYFGYRFLSNLAKANESISTYITPILIAYVVFALLTWFAVPLSNLLLRLSRFGRHALSRDQRISSNWFAACLAVFAVGAIGAIAFDKIVFFVLALFGAGMALPLTTIYNCDIGWPRRAMSYYTAGMAIVGGLMLGSTVFGTTTGEPAEVSLIAVQLFVLGIIGSPWAANYFAGATARR